MRLTRVYQPIALSINQVISLTPQATNHLVRVLRLVVGDQFIIFDGHGGEYVAEIAEIKKQYAMARIGEYRDCKVESPLNIHLGQAISRGEKMDFTIQKAVELGVTQITPLITERCGVKLSAERWEKRLQHWQGIVISACEQSGRDRIPSIAAPTSLSHWVANTSAEWKLILHPHADQVLRDVKEQPRSIDLLIGPEGGFDESEVKFAQRSRFMALQLGPRILRTETAALVAITTLQNWFGDIG